MSHTDTEEHLRRWVPRAVAGEPHAVTAVVHCVRPHVLSFCTARMDDATLAHTPVEDVVQEVCLALVRALPRYRDRGASLLRFAYAIAVNKIADARRGAARTTAPIHQVAAPAPDEDILDSELASTAKRFIDQLPEQQRWVLILRVIRGYSAERTATMLGTTPGAVRVAQHRALTRVRTQLSLFEHEDTVRSAAR